MDQEPDVIRRQIDQTRSSLTEKLETLECQVKGTMDEARCTVQTTFDTARSTVESTLENVRNTVDHTVAAVKQTFDLRYQTERHPWPMVGGSIVAGFVTGALLGRQLASAFEKHPEPTPSRSPFTPPPPRQEPQQPAQPGLIDRLRSEFSGEIQQVKKMAISSLMAVLRDMAKQAVPPNFAPQVEHIMDDLTTRMGGEPVEGPILEPSGRAETAGFGGRRW